MTPPLTKRQRDAQRSAHDRLVWAYDRLEARINRERVESLRIACVRWLKVHQVARRPEA